MTSYAEIKHAYTLIAPPNPASFADIASSAATSQSAATIITLAQAYSATTMKLKSILRK